MSCDPCSAQVIACWRYLPGVRPSKTQFGGCQLPVSAYAPIGPAEMTADDLDRVQGHPGIGVHHGDRRQRRVNQGTQQVLEAVTVSQLGQGAEGAVIEPAGLMPSQTGSPVSAAACSAARP